MWARAHVRAGSHTDLKARPQKSAEAGRDETSEEDWFP